jgi:hypothetical protein
MTSRKRYTLVAIGFIAFILLSPFVVMYVTGTRYDSATHRFIKTGALAAKTSPRGALISLNGEELKKSPATIRFLNPGDYDVQISKEGYFNWNKRLNIKPQYVTWANRELESVLLFFENPERTELNQEVLTFVAGDKKLAYLTNDSAYFADSEEPQDSESVALLYPISGPVSLKGSPDERYYLIQGNGFNWVFDSNTKEIIDLKTLVKADQNSKEETFLDFSLDNRLYSLVANTLSQINWRENQKKELLNNILAFTAQDQDIYAINNQKQLLHISLPSLDSDVLAENLPVLFDAKLYITSQNQIFVLADQGLFAVSNKISRIADYVKSVQLIDQFNKVAYATANEIGLYDTVSQTTELITRSSKQIKYPKVFVKLGWSFFINDNRLQALEIDSRDHQNNYTIAEADDNSSFWIDSDAKHIILLNDGKLERLLIR